MGSFPCKGFTNFKYILLLTVILLIAVNVLKDSVALKKLNDLRIEWRRPALTTTQEPLSTLTTRGSLPPKKVIECRKKNLNTKIPNIIHHVWFGNRTFEFVHYISLRSAALIQRPEKVYLHYNEVEPQGPLWDLYKSEVPCLVLVECERPTSIFGRKVNVVEHQADVARLDILMNHGGIYLDTDVVVVNPFDPVMNYSAVIGLEAPGLFCAAIILAEPHSKFVTHWYSTYKTFNDGEWNQHSGKMPVKINKGHPEFGLHVEENTFLRPSYLDGMVWFEKKNWDISENYCVHLFARFLQKETIGFGEWEILELNATYGALARIGLYGKPDLIHI